MKPTVLSLLPLVFAAACGCGPHRTANTPAAMKAAVQKLIPPGTPLDEARRAMEAAGYTVTTMADTAFSEDGVVHRGIDYLYCDCTEHRDVLLERRWQVALVHASGGVSDVFVSMGLTGP